jgi:cytoskeletal protein RodZ
MSFTALPRPVLLGIVGVALIGVFFFATHRPKTTSSSTPAPSQIAPPAQSPTAKPGSASATTPHPGRATSKPKSTTGPAGRGLPKDVKRALDAHKTVVILFWNRHGVDDRSVKSAVDHLPHHRKVAVFSDRVKNLSRYTRVAAATSVSTTPSLVIVSPKGQAEVVTGYLDSQTVRQYVTNASRR